MSLFRFQVITTMPPNAPEQHGVIIAGSWVQACVLAGKRFNVNFKVHSGVPIDENDIIERARIAADAIAWEVIGVARNSGSNPLTFVTSNAYMPPLRSFAEAETIWQLFDATNVAWETLVEDLDDLLDRANVLMECPDYDNALYVVDLARFEFDDTLDDGDPEDDLSDYWVPRETS